MKTAPELMRAAVAAPFVDDGVLELYTLNSRAQRPAETVAERGKIKLLREACDTLAAARAFEE